MRLTIRVDPATSLAAGYEPTTSLDLDLAPLSPSDRAAIAAIMEGTVVRPKLGAPTTEALLETARSAQQEREAAAAIEASRQAERDARRMANSAELRDLLARKPTVTKLHTRVSRIDGDCSWDEIVPDVGMTETYDVDPELRDAYYAWRDELAAANRARADAAQATVRMVREAELAAGRLARCTMTVEQIIASLPEAIRSKFPAGKATYDRLESDAEGIVVLSGPTGHPAVSRVARANLRMMDVDFRRRIGGEEYEGVSYDVADGVFAVPGSNWVARVTDPSAAKPVYQFLDRCPGGYEVPALAAGDVLVWGSKDKKGRKVGPYDRLVYVATGSAVASIKCDYATARRVRKLLIA